MPKKNDTYFKAENGTFTIGAGKAEKTLVLTNDGRYLMQKYEDKDAKYELAQQGAILSDEFFVTVDGVKLSGGDKGWGLVGTSQNTLNQGELEAVITLKKGNLEVERHYVAYPGTSIIQEWTVYRNLSEKEMQIARPSLFVQRIMAEDALDLDFVYMTGGANFTGSCTLKTVPVTDGFVKDFDAHGEPEMSEIDGKFVNEWHPRWNGTGMWFEFFALQNRVSKNNWFMNFDYQGWWKAGFTNRDGNLSIVGWCELLNHRLPAGESMRIAPMMCGLCKGDLDDMGNYINDYIYTYKWDYTREAFFTRTTLSIWREAPMKEKVFKMIEAARYIGTERIHIDDFWFDAKGNYNEIFGDDFKDFNDYIKRNGMFMRVWMPPWHADRLSDVWLKHPDWMLDFHGNWYNWTIDMSKEEAYQWILNMLCEKQEKWGNYELRVDGDPVMMWNDGSFHTSGGNWDGNFKQSENFYRLYKEFKDKNPNSGIDGCSSGGHTITIESVRYTDQQQITDGRCEHMGGYWTTMIMPIDKHQGMPISGRKRRNWHNYTTGCMSLFSAPGEMMQDPEKGWCEQALESVRKEYELFYWLRLQGVYGRWIKVYRPGLTYGDPTFILQRMTGDGNKGMVMISSNDLNPILNKPATIFPKGLLPDEPYSIEALRSGMSPATRTGREWMEKGIELENVVPGEYLFINLPGRPGQGADTEPPTAPGFAQKEQAEWLGHKGVGLSWGKAEDNVMVSYYLVEKNGKPATKVSIGLYWFDDGGSLSDEYKVCAVDGDGNRSPLVAAV